MAHGINSPIDDGDEDAAAIHEINVVPFIDIVLVLLIVFMVAAPLATVSDNINLPSSTATPQPRPDEPLYLSLGQNLSLKIGDHPIERARLGQALDDFTDGDRQTRVYLRADKTVNYGKLMALLNDLRAAGYTSVALVGQESAGTTTGATTQGQQRRHEGHGSPQTRAARVDP